ncbi:CD99 molecule isoform X2 [Cottoperca gobio]|uniref:CD99 molecule isoform X2 n=1 Tax=Cottoperca gobio TaxID=56716 RepID=A0A6J2RCD7_COTGO|nr:CD99 antigen-like protein 2 isoform X2 [Cottoperca gobio]
MKFCLRIGLLLFLVTGTLTQNGFDLSDAFDDLDPTPAKPKEQPKAPEKPKHDGGLDLSDAFAPDEPTKEPKKPSSRDSGGFDLEDAFGPDLNPKTDKPAVKPPNSGGGGGTFDDSDLFDAGADGYKPDAGRPGGGGGADPDYNPNGGADQPQDPDLLWGQILKMLNANMPEEFYMWMSNLKQIVTPLLERAMALLQAVP